MKEFSKRLVAFLMLVMMLAGLLLIPGAATKAEASSAQTPAQITAKIDAYYKAVTSGTKGTVFWNAKLKTGTLKTQADAGNYKAAVTETACKSSGSYTDRTTHNQHKGCQANGFNGAADAWTTAKAKERDKDIAARKAAKTYWAYDGGGYQCSGFADYMLYVLFHSTSKNDFYYAEAYTSVFTKTYPFYPGDLIRWGGHSAIVYKVDGEKVSFIECNYTDGAGAKANCVIHKGTRTVNAADLRKAIVKTVSTNNKSKEKNYILIPKENLRSTPGIATAPVITTQPKNTSVYIGETASFTVKAYGVGLSYQWQSSPDGKTWSNCKYDSSKKATLSFTALPPNDLYQLRCAVTNEKGTTYSKAVKLTLKYYVTSIELNKSSVSLGLKKSVTLKATVLPDIAADKSIKWKSSDTSIATVDSNGKVTAKAKGTVTITAKAKDGSGVKATCKVTVGKAVTGITLNKTSLKMSLGTCYQLVATVSPKDAVTKAVSWSSSDKTIATVDSNGVVTVLKAGTVTITAKAKDGSGVKATCKITIK